MKLTADERRALAFLAALLSLSAVVRFLGLPDPVTVDGEAVDLAAHIEAVEAAVAEAAARERPLEPGETVDPNTAAAAELVRLPGVGPALAERIAADREEHGPFRRLEDLTRVSGIGPRTLARLAPHLALRARGSLEPTPPLREPAGRTRPVQGRGAPGPAEPLDVNAAGVEALATLPGIGPVLAARIVAYRDSAGPFRSFSELGAVKGIGPATLARLAERAVVR